MAPIPESWPETAKMALGRFCAQFLGSVTRQCTSAYALAQNGCYKNTACPITSSHSLGFQPVVWNQPVPTLSHLILTKSPSPISFQQNLVPPNHLPTLSPQPTKCSSLSSQFRKDLKTRQRLIWMFNLIINFHYNYFYSITLKKIIELPLNWLILPFYLLSFI